MDPTLKTFLYSIYEKLIQEKNLNKILDAKIFNIENTNNEEIAIITQKYLKKTYRFIFKKKEKIFLVTRTVKLNKENSLIYLKLKEYKKNTDIETEIYKKKFLIKFYQKDFYYSIDKIKTHLYDFLSFNEENLSDSLKKLKK